MRAGKTPYNRIIATILFICMLISIFPQTVLSSDSSSNNNAKIEKSQLAKEKNAKDNEYSSLTDRAKQELIVKYKDGNKRIDIKEKNKEPKMKNLKVKKKLNKKTDLLEIDSTDNINDVITTLQQDPNVEYAQPNYEVSMLSMDDAYIGLQWGIQKDRQNADNALVATATDINLIPMLDVPAENEVIVAVIDSGIEITHEDLWDKIYTNPREVMNGIDDDGNGYIDDINGWNFYGGNSDVRDYDGHGTHIAGIIGASENTIGVMGVAQNVKLLPLKVMENGIGYTSDVIEAIQYAESMGAKIANCSFGSTYYNYAMYEAMSGSSMAFICAAGNTGTISNIYPASYELSNILSVTSIDSRGLLAYNATYGQTVDIAAPGVDIYSTTINNSYTYGSGSSYSAAYATGAAARLLGIKDMLAVEAISVLRQGAAKTANLAGYVKTGGMLNVAGSYDLIKDGQNIEIDSGFTYDEVILQILNENNYFGLTEEEKEYLLDYFHISRESLEECLRAGYTLSESVNYAKSMGRYGFTLGEILTLYGMYNESWECDLDLSFLDILIQKYSVTEDDLSAIRSLMLSGQKARNITKTYIVSQALEIPIYTLIKKDTDISENGYMNISDTSFTEDEKKNIWIFCINNWLDVNVLIDYMTANNLTYQELLNKVTHDESNIVAALSGENANKYPDAPFSYRKGMNERVNLNTGSLVYESTDAVLPGKNGMDLVITSRYDSSNANIQDTYLSQVVDYYQKVVYVTIATPAGNQNATSPGDTTTSLSDAQAWAAKPMSYTQNGSTTYYYTFSYITVYKNSYTTNLRQSSCDLKNNLGSGWAFGFSYIETIDGYSYLHLSDGTVYKISSVGAWLENYPLTDIQIAYDSSFTNGQVTSIYSLKYKNGVNEYFSSDGRLLGRKDRFGNTIKFEHTQINGKYLITKITDTLNRVVTITYQAAGGNVVVTLPDGSQITYVLEAIPGYYATTCKLIQKKDQLGRVTNFTYTADSVYESYNSGLSTSATKNYVNLTKVTYPTGAASNYTYAKVSEHIGTIGSTQVFKITQRSDSQSSGTYNIETYAYTGSYTASEYASMDAAPSTYTYSTAVTASATGNKTTSTFNKQHLPINVTTYNSSGVKLLENIYSYNTNKQMIKSDERTYAANGTTYMSSINNYEYDIKNNITAHWGPLAAGNTASGEYKETYIYNPTYSYMTSKQYKQNSTKTITEEYTPSADSKTITTKTIYETVGTNARVAKETTSYLYDAYGNITQETNGTYITKYGYTYNTDGTSVKTVWTENVKDADGALVAGTPGNAAGVVKSTYAYDKMGRLVTSTDGRGYNTTYTYDLLGRQTRVTNPDGTYKAYTYETTTAVNALTETNEKGTATKYVYDGFGNISSVIDAASGATVAAFTYDGKLRLTQESTLTASSATGSRTTYAYDALDRVLTKTTYNSGSAVLSQETYAYDDANQSGLYRLVTHTVVGDANAPSVKTTAYTDNAGRTVKQGYFIGATEYTDDYTYDYAGNKLTVKTAQTKSAWNTYAYTTKWDYDYANRVTNEYDIFGNYSATAYNGVGLKVSWKDAKGTVTTYEYDALGRLIIQSTPFEGTAVSKTKYYYDQNNNVTQKKVTSNAVGAAEQYTIVGYEYNSRNMLTKTTNYNLNGTAASYVQYYYDAMGSVLRMYTGLSAPLTISGLDVVTGTVNCVTKYEYDRFGNMTKLTDPMGYIETYTYDLLGRMLTKTDRKGTIFTYTYDGLGRLLNTKNGATVLEEYTYTLTGSKRTENNSTVQTTNTYDSLGRLSAAADKNVATGVITTKTYGYNIALNRTSAVITVGSVTTNSTTYTYDAMNRMKTVLEGGVLQCTYNYDANGNRSSLVYPNGVTTEYTYNLANMVKTLANKSGAAVLSSYTYAYQLDGNQISKTDQAGKVTSYVYDGLGRLTSEVEKTGATVTFSLAYAYDANNNRVSMTANMGAVTTYAYDKNNRLTTETAAGVASTYTYDNNGNTLTKTKSGVVAETYTYDLLNRMVSSTVGGVAATYKYRADGLRYSKTVSGVETAHIWDGSNIVGDVAGSAVTATYVRGVGLIASKAGGVFTYYLFNGHGDVVQLANNAGTVTKTYDYDAFGNEKNIVATDANVFRYCAEYFDKETGTVYLRARFYQPKTGRFTTEDSYRGYVKDPLSLNYYVYGYNNPVKYSDPSGHIIQMSSTNTAEQNWEIIGDLQMLTNDILGYNEKNNTVVNCTPCINYLNKMYKAFGFPLIKLPTDKPKGTQLVGDSINSTYTTTIIYDSTITDNVTGFPSSSMENVSKGIPTNAKIKYNPNLDPYNYYALNKVNKDGTNDIVNDEKDNYISLGHELIHANAIITGTFVYDKSRDVTYTAYGVTYNVKTEDEDLLTVGLIKGRPITENDLLIEQGHAPRGAIK